VARASLPWARSQTHKREYFNRIVRGSLRQAQAYLTKRLHERDLCRGIESVQVTLDEFLDHWLKAAARPKVREKTYRDYEAMLRRYVRPSIGAEILGALSPLSIQGAYQQMIERGLSSRTIRYTNTILRSALGQAIRWRLLLNDPTQGVQLPRQQRREMRVLTTEQARAFLRIAVPTRHGCIFAMALTTGLRPSEYLALCWRDINWEHGTVSVVRTLQRNEGEWRFVETKRVRSRRVVKLQDWVLNLLKQMRNETPGETVKEERDARFSGLIFNTSINGLEQSDPGFAARRTRAMKACLQNTFVQRSGKSF
jgi:integrase